MAEEIVDVFIAKRKLGCSRMSVYRYIEKGLLPARKVSGEFFFRMSDLESVHRPQRGRPRKTNLL